MKTAHQFDASSDITATFEAVVQSFYKTIELRDPYTAGHQKRVANLAVAVAKKLNWRDEKIQGLYLAGLIHDIGKVGVPSELLVKPTRLTPLEMELVRQHSEAGYEILKEIPFPWPIAQIVRQHHERLDGTGYPNHLVGDDILDEAKLLAVVDTIEAMASHRPYRPGLGIEAAIKEVRLESGKQLDSTYVEAACLVIEEEGGLDFISK